jgi:hypothetical protein
VLSMLLDWLRWGKMGRRGRTQIRRVLALGDEADGKCLARVIVVIHT